MNRLVLQQQTARSLTAAANPVADRAAEKLAGPGADFTQASNITADRPATFAHTLDRKTKAAPAAKDRTKHLESTSRGSEEKTKTPQDRSAPSGKSDRSQPTDQTPLGPGGEPASDVQDASGRLSATKPAGTSADPSAPVDGSAAPPVAPSDDADEKTKPVAEAPPAQTPSPTLPLQAPLSAQPETPVPVDRFAQITTTPADLSVAATSAIVGVTVQQPATAAAPRSAAATSEDGASAPGRTPPAGAKLRVTSPQPADPQSLPTPANEAAAAPTATPAAASESAAKVGKSNAGAEPSSQPVRNASAARAKNQADAATEAESAADEEYGESDGATALSPPAGAKGPTRASDVTAAATTHLDPGAPSNDALSNPISKESPLQPLVAVPTSEKAATAPSETRDPGSLAPSLAATSRAMDLLGRLVAEPASSFANQPAAGAQSSPEFQRALQAQVARGIEQAAQQAAAAGSWTGVGVGSSSSVTLRLHPANLGMMRVYLRMDTEPGGRGGSGGGSGGGVRARFEVSNARTKEMLGSSIASLKSALEARGLSVAEVSVTEMAQMPEREFGRPPVAESAGDDGAAFAKSTSSQRFDAGRAEGMSAASGARVEASAETDGEADLGAADFRWEGGGRPVALAAHSTRSSPLIITPDGRVSVDALV